jgi:hypothetical protein
MISGIEAPFMFAFFYPYLNYVWWFPKQKPEIEREIFHRSEETNGIEIYEYYSQYIPPTYVTVGTVNVPVGGYTTQETRSILSRHICKGCDGGGYYNYYQVNNKADRSASFLRIGHINDYDGFNALFNNYMIPKDKVRVKLPLLVEYYKYKDGIYFHQNTGLVASNKNSLVQAVLWRKRLPFSLTIPAGAILCLSMSWVHYGLMPHQGLPPFHLKRLQKYLNAARSNFSFKV